MKIIISFLLLFTISTIAYGFQTDDDWITFSSDEGNFSVLMPTQPKIESATNDTPNGRYTVYSAISIGNNSMYLAGWADYSFKVDVEGEINANRDNLLKILEATLITEKKITFDKYPGIEFTAKLNSGKLIKSRVYLINNRPYQLIAAGNGEDDENTDKFLSSFKLITK